MGCGCNKNKGKILVTQNGPRSGKFAGISSLCPRCRSVLRTFNKYDAGTRRMVRKVVCSNKSCGYST